MLTSDVASPHALACDPSCQFELAERECELFLPVARRPVCRTSCTAAVDRCAHRPLGGPQAVVQRILSFVVERRSTLFAHRRVPRPFLCGRLWQSPTARLSAPRTALCVGPVLLRDPPRAHVRLPLLPFVSLCASCPDGSFPCFAQAHLSGDTLIHVCGNECTPHLLAPCLGALLGVEPSDFVLVPMLAFPQTEQSVLIMVHELHHLVKHTTRSLVPAVLTNDTANPLCVFGLPFLIPRLHCSIKCSSIAIAWATWRTHAPVGSVSLQALLKSTRTCRCVPAHFLRIRTPNCRALVNTRTPALMNLGPPSSHSAKPNMHRSAATVLAPYMTMSYVTHFILVFASDVTSCTKQRPRATCASYSSRCNVAWSRRGGYDGTASWRAPRRDRSLLFCWVLRAGTVPTCRSSVTRQMLLGRVLLRCGFGLRLQFFVLGKKKEFHVTLVLLPATPNPLFVRPNDDVGRAALHNASNFISS